MHNKRTIIFIALLLILLLGLLAGCRGQNEEINSPEQLNSSRYKVGVSQGSAGAAAAIEAFPQARIKHYTSDIAAYTSVQMGKIDAYAYDRVMLEFAIADGLAGVKLLDEDIGETVDIAVGVSKNSDIPDLLEKVNAFLAAMRADGTMDDMYYRWIRSAMDTMPDIPAPEDPAFTLTVGTTGLVKPFSYYKGDQLNGYDIELIYRFAAWLNADVEIKIYDYSGIFPAAATGTIDCIMANLNITEERKEMIDFSAPIYGSRTGLMVRELSAQGSSAAGFWERLENSFERTFVTEGRWRMIFSGLGVTVLISLLSGVFGTLLGFGLCIMSLARSKPLRGTSTVFIRVIQGLPVVVFLLILYYVIFGTVDISDVAVAVIGFSINLGVYASVMMRSGILAVPAGQIEAATALGYDRWQTFRKVTFPQAARHFLPVFRGEFISMVKMTSVVGYIAVQDLTKASDIIRAQTLEAFFPLIVTAVFYFIIVSLLTGALARIEFSLDTERRPRVVKGVSET